MWVWKNSHERLNINGNRRNEMKLFHEQTSISSQDESVAHLLSERHLRMCLTILRYLKVNIKLNVGNESFFFH